MTWARIALGALQALGGVSFLPYPAILIASVMGIAGEGPRGVQRLLVALPYIAVSLYPVVWIALYRWSWRAMNEGATARAFILSGVPVVLSLAGVGWYWLSELSDKKRRATNA